VLGRFPARRVGYALGAESPRGLNTERLRHKRNQILSRIRATDGAMHTRLLDMLRGTGGRIDHKRCLVA